MKETGHAAKVRAHLPAVGDGGRQIDRDADHGREELVDRQVNDDHVERGPQLREEADDGPSHSLS